MKQWIRTVVISLCAAAAGHALEIQHWSGGLCASIWDPAYKKGLGGLAGVEAHVPIKATVAAAELGYAYYQARYAGSADVHEIYGTLGLRREFHPFPDEVLYPRLGVHAGASSNYKQSLHLLAGINVDGVIRFSKKGSVLLAFQPSYSMGEKSRFFWRAAFGVLIDVNP